MNGVFDMHSTGALTSDPGFLGTLKEWLGRQGEILILVHSSRSSGSQGFEFFSNFENLEARLHQLPAGSTVTAFKQNLLPLRGVVDDAFIARCLENIPDDGEYLVVETVPQMFGDRTWYHDYAGISHIELRDDLEESRGIPVAAGIYPTWLEDSADVMVGVVPGAPAGAKPRFQEHRAVKKTATHCQSRHARRPRHHR